MVFRYFRERIFAFTGAYAMVVFYNNAQIELSDPVTGHVIKDKIKVNPRVPTSNSGNVLNYFVPNFMGRYADAALTKPIARPSDDVRWAVVEYDVQTGLLMGLLIMAGGWFAIGGAATALMLEVSMDGPQMYDDIRDYLRKV